MEGLVESALDTLRLEAVSHIIKRERMSKLKIDHFNGFIRVNEKLRQQDKLPPQHLERGEQSESQTKISLSEKKKLQEP